MEANSAGIYKFKSKDSEVNAARIDNLKKTVL